MNIAVITGASSGLGREFAITISKKYPELDRIWLIARREDKLKEVATVLGDKAMVIPLDLSDEASANKYKALLKENSADIKILVNNAGFGKLGYFETIDEKYNTAMVRLNCEALTVFTQASLDFMKENSQIINISSIASFAPNSRMAVYCSTKAYVMSFSRALREELKRRKINVLAVCPGPMDTEFLPVANIEKGTSHTFDTLPRVSPKAVAEGSLKYSKRKKAVYTNKAFYNFYRLIAKLLPHSLVMKMSAT